MNLIKSISILVLLSHAKAYAAFTSTFDLNSGISSFQITASTDARTLTSATTVDFSYNLNNPIQGIGYFLNFFELVNSTEGSLAVTRSSFGVKWFPTGLNGSTVIIDNGVKAKVLKPTTYLGLGLGIANLSTIAYNASVFDLSPKVGIEVPITSNLLANFQYVFSKNLTASTKSAETNITYTGNSFLFGIVIANYE